MSSRLRQRALGPDHPDTLATRFCIAREMAARGDHAGAENQFRHVLAGQTRSLGPDHPDTLISWFSIAREMAARGDHAGAEDEFRDMLPHLERAWARTTRTRWPPGSASLRRWPRAAITPERRRSSGRCLRPGRRHWARITPIR